MGGPGWDMIAQRTGETVCCMVYRDVYNGYAVSDRLQTYQLIDADGSSVDRDSHTTPHVTTIAQRFSDDPTRAGPATVRTMRSTDTVELIEHSEHP